MIGWSGNRLGRGAFVYRLPPIMTCMKPRKVQSCFKQTISKPLRHMNSIALRELILIGLYAALAMIWTVATLWLAPDLARLEAGLLAMGISFALALTLGQFDNRQASTRTSRERSWDRWLSLVLLLVATAFLAVTVSAGPVHDYGLYLNFWSQVLKGRDPWYILPGFWGNQPPNAYGPLFNLLAVLIPLNRLAPKLVFASTYIAAAAILTKTLAARRPNSWLTVLGLLAWAWNPFVWIEVAIRGHFDVLVGAASVAAVHARRKGCDWTCASALAGGVLLKYIPIVLLPFLFLDNGRIQARLAWKTMTLLAIGMGLSFLAWGPSMFGPLSFAATRASTYLSIFRFLGGRYSPLHAIGLEKDLDRLALPALALALLGAWFWCRVRQPDPSTAATLAVLVTLLLYRNGFPQYQMVPLMLASYGIVQRWKFIRHRVSFAIALLVYTIWIVTFDVAYTLIGDNAPYFEDAVGLPTFLLGLALAVCLMRSEPPSQTYDS